MRLAFAAGLAVVAALGQARTARADVALRERAGVYQLDGIFSVQASSALVWGVLTDYEGIGRFVDSIKESRVLKRERGGVIIEQVGRAGFLIFSKEVKLVLAVDEQPDSEIDFRELQGPFERYVGSWRIRAGGGGCLVCYRLDAQPAASLVPGFVARRVMRKTVGRLLEEVRREIERRAAAHG